MTQINNWEENIYIYVNNGVSPQRTLIPSPSSISFNARQRRAVRYLENPIRNVPTRSGTRNLHIRVTNIPTEQQNTYIDPGSNLDITRKIIASTLIIGPPGTGKTHVICSGSILRVFTDNNLRRVRQENGRPERIFIATFSNAGAYRILEKFFQISQAAGCQNFFERIKLVQSDFATESYAFHSLQNKINLDPDLFTIPNRQPRGNNVQRNEWLERLQPILIFIGTTDSLAILSREISVRGVIFDEASQITVPQFFQVIPGQNMTSICVVGDDKQIPPVATLAPLGLSSISYLQGRNAYQNSPIPHSRMIELQEQYRMHPAIAQLTEKILPVGRTVIPAGSTVGNYTLSNFHPVQSAQFTNINIRNLLNDILRPEHSVVIIDTSDIINAYDQQIGHSRVNRKEAELAICIYNALRSTYPQLDLNEIIITAPYREQVGIFEQNNIRTGTVHQYQGQESEVVIYSLTFARPNTKSDFFSQYNLMYVGLSRAKKKLIILGNKDALNHPDRGIQIVRDRIFNYNYSSGRTGYPTYTTDPVLIRKPNDTFFNILKQIYL